jgi:DNA-binding NarL/FixJ family response regulator
MDGFETCRRLKARGHLAHVPVIFMTGLSETEHIVRGLEAGGVDYVTKPIAPDEILARIRVHLAGARVAQSARAALDTAGRTLFAVDGQGAILWSTPQAARLLAGIAPPDGAGLPPQARAWLVACRAGTASGALTLTDGNGIVHTLSVIGGTGDEILLRLARDSGEAGIERLRARLPVTGREAEVLLWLSRGKASRDIGEILGLSPRTVTKHLEGIYAKLGVENRTAASLIAARHLQDLE